MIPPLDQGQNGNNPMVLYGNQNSSMTAQPDPNTQSTPQDPKKSVSEYLTQYNKQGVPIEVPAWVEDQKATAVEQTPVVSQIETPVIQEKQPVTEIYKAPETPSPAQNSEDQTKQQPLDNNNANTTSNKVPDTVVDKTKEITHLHPLTDTQDKLTTIADAEEADFIEKVEAAHGHN